MTPASSRERASTASATSTTGCRSAWSPPPARTRYRGDRSCAARRSADESRVVTGASGGVVAGIARRVVEAGAAVVVHYRSDADGAAAVVDAIGAAGSRAIAAGAELLGRAAEPTRFRRYGIGGPMPDACCWATRPAAVAGRHPTPPRRAFPVVVRGGV